MPVVLGIKSVLLRIFKTLKLCSIPSCTEYLVECDDYEKQIV